MDGRRGVGSRAGRRDRWFQGGAWQGQGARWYRARRSEGAYKGQPSQRRTTASWRARADRIGRDRRDVAGPIRGSRRWLFSVHTLRNLRRLIGFSATAATGEGTCIERDSQQRCGPAGYGGTVGGPPVHGSESGSRGGFAAFPDLGAGYLAGCGRHPFVRRDGELVDRAAFVRHLLGQKASTRPHAARCFARRVRNGTRRRGAELFSDPALCRSERYRGGCVPPRGGEVRQLRLRVEPGARYELLFRGW